MLLIVLAEVLVNVSRGCFVLALGMYFYTQTQSLWAFSLTFIADFVVAVVLQGLAGQFVDRLGPKKILIVAAALCAVLFIPFSWLVSVGGEIWLLMILVVLHNAVRPFIRAAVFAIVPLLEPDKKQLLNARLSIALQVGQVLGVVVAGISLELSSYSITFLLVGVCYALALICYANIDGVAVAKKAIQNTRGIFATLLHLIRTNRVFMQSSIIAAVDFTLVGMLNILIAPTVEFHFGGRPVWLTVIELVFAVGAIAAGLLVGRVFIGENKYWIVTLSACLVSAGLFLMMGTQVYISLLVAALFFMGFLTTWSSVIWVTALQNRSPEEYLGRLGSIRLIVNASFLSLSAFSISHFATSSYQAGAKTALAVSLIAVAMIIFLAFLIGQAQDPDQTDQHHNIN